MNFWSRRLALAPPRTRRRVRVLASRACKQPGRGMRCELRELYGVGDGGALLRGDGRRGDGDGFDLGAGVGWGRSIS